jgi:hypothetical protein
MGNIKEQEVLVIYALTRHTVMESSERVRAGHAVGYGNDTRAQNSF